MASSASTLELLGTEDNPDQIVFANTFNTATVNITIQKNLTSRKSSDANTDLSFSFKIEFDDVADMGLEDAYAANGTQTTDIVLEQAVSITLTGNSLSNSSSQYSFVVPVGTKYRITETSIPTDYTMQSNSHNDWTTVTENTTVTATVTNASPNEPDPTPTPAPIVLKIQKVWGSGIDTKPTVSFLIQKNGTAISGATAIDASGNAVTIANGMITLSSDRRGTATASDGTDDREAWVVYVFDTNNTNSSEITYSITEYYNGSAVTQTNNVYSFTVGTGDDAVTYQVAYTPGGLPPASANGGNCLSLPLSEFSGITNFATTYADYINNNDTPTDTDDDTVRVLPLSVLNTKPTQTDTPETGGHGGYIPIAGGFIVILLAGAGYFIYKKRIFA